MTDAFGNTEKTSGVGHQYIGEARSSSVLCQIGALNLKSTGHIAGKFSRLTPDISNESHPSTLNFYLESTKRHEKSKELQQLEEPGAGFILHANASPGAPMSTFVYGGIAADEPHPVLNLIKGPPKTAPITTITNSSIEFYTEPYITYTRDAFYGDIETDLSNVDSSADINAYYVNNNPLIPTRKDENITIYDDASTLHTYNIWKLKYPSRFTTDSFNIEDYISYMKNFGPIVESAGLEEAYDGPLITQQVYASGSKVSIASPKDFVFAERIYPISYDLLYKNRNSGSSVKAYYSLILTDDGNLAAAAPKEVNMNGGINCGFQMNLSCSGIDPNYLAKEGAVAPRIVINWGDYAGEANADSISRFQLIISGQGTELRFYNPTLKNQRLGDNVGEATSVNSRWQKIQLPNGPQLSGESADIQIYIHYAGPYMLIGFDGGGNGTPKWYAFGPVEDDSNPFYKLNPSISSEATVAIGVGYMTCVFQYGPMTFKNYNNQNITNVQALQNEEHLNYVDFAFTAPEDKLQYLDQDDIEENFYNLRYISRSDAKNQDTNMSYAPDWRTDPKTQLSFVWREGPAILPTSADDPQEVDVQYYTKGTLRFNTTFESPIFFEVTNNITPTIQPEPPYVPLNINDDRRVVGSRENGIVNSDSGPDELIRNFKWGDLSGYLTEWSMSYSCEDSANSSYMGMKGRAVFENLALDDTGRKILSAMNNNFMTITLGAGYGEATPIVYGQGVIENVNTTRSSKGSTTVVQFTDIGTHLLAEKNFKDPYIFGGMKYRRIVQSILEILGLDKYYSQRPESASENWARALNLRAALSALQRTVAAGVLRADIRTIPLVVLKKVLSIMIEKDATPVMFWDAVDELYRLEWRQDSEFLETLYFAGYRRDDGYSVLPNNQEDDDSELRLDWQHGVLTNNWANNTEFQNLIQKLLLYAKDVNGKLISYQHYPPNAISDSTWDTLNDLENISIDDIPSGYVGYERIRFSQDDAAIFEDRQALYRYGDAVSASIVGKPYNTIQFQIYVTRPLLHWGRFQLKSFIGNSSVHTEPYYYKSVEYKYEKARNIITADVTGEYTPPLKHIVDRIV